MKRGCSLISLTATATYLVIIFSDVAKDTGEGTCVYVKDILTTKIINCDTVRPDGIEDIWVSVQYRKLPSIIIGSIYRHPKAPQETFEYIRETLRTIWLRNKSIYIYVW